MRETTIKYQGNEANVTSRKGDVNHTLEENNIVQNTDQDHSVCKNVKHPHILSMMEPRNAFQYAFRPQTVGEIAYQMAKIEYIEGKDSPFLETIYHMTDGLKVKAFVKENVP